MNEKYFLVEAMCGHVGTGAYIPVIFPVYAENGKIAASIARDIPRVKHNNKYAILAVRKVSYEEYQNQQDINRNDPYLNWSFVEPEKYFEEVYSRIIHIQPKDNYPKRKNHGKFNTKKSTAAKLYVKELLSDLDDLLDNFSRRICKNF